MDKKFNQNKNIKAKPTIISVEKLHNKYTVIKPNEVQETGTQDHEYHIQNKLNVKVNGIHNGQVNSDHFNKRYNQKVTNNEMTRKMINVFMMKQTMKPTLVDVKCKTEDKLNFHDRCTHAKYCYKTGRKLYLNDSKLDKPEYNSIKCTIKKINEIKQEVVAKDFNSLPPSIRQNIGKKVSRSVNFPLKDVIYEGLINLSIEDF